MVTKNVPSVSSKHMREWKSKTYARGEEQEGGKVRRTPQLPSVSSDMGTSNIAASFSPHNSLRGDRTVALVHVPHTPVSRCQPERPRLAAIVSYCTYCRKSADSANSARGRPSGALEFS